MAGRSANGRFAPGNPGGPGRPPRATEATYLRVLADACPAETWAKICRRAVQRAEMGDGAARAWLSKYLMEGMTLHAAQALTDQEAEEAAFQAEIDEILAGRA